MREDRLVFGQNINHDSANYLRSRVAHILALPEVTGLTIMFSSEGGHTDQGHSLHNFLKAAQKPLHMHAVGHVGSVGNALFLGGHRRTSSSTGRFFFHEYDWGFGGANQTLRRINEAVQRLGHDIETSRQIFRSRFNPTPEILAALDGSGPSVILDPADAEKLGYIHEVVELPAAPAPDDQIVLWT